MSLSNIARRVQRTKRDAVGVTLPKILTTNGTRVSSDTMIYSRSRRVINVPVDL